jgi:hypothetical protein
MSYLGRVSAEEFRRSIYGPVLFNQVSKMLTKRKSLFLIVAMFLGAILFGLARYRPSSPAVLGVGLLGYTNGVTGERFARFVITNQSRMTVRRWGHFDRQVRKAPLLAYTRRIGTDLLLSPGQAEVVLVPLDAEPAFAYQKGWRAVFYWRREDLKTRFDIWTQTLPWLPTSFRGVRVNAAPSGWMDQ